MKSALIIVLLLPLLAGIYVPDARPSGIQASDLRPFNLKGVRSTRSLPLRSHPAFPWSRRAARNRAGYYEQPAGLCEDYPEDDRSPEKLRQDFETVRRTGARLLRFGISWLDVEKAPGQYDWSFWDRFVAMAARYQITLLPYVCYTPEWAGRASDDFWRLPPRDPGRYEAFMTTIARRYRGRIRSWELWNEPDNPQFWQGTVEEYAQLLAAGARGVRQAAPDANLVLGGLAFGPGNFLKTLLIRYHVQDMVDVVNFHGYNETWSPDQVERYADQIEAVRALLSSVGSDLDLWMAEFGYSDYRFETRQASEGGVRAIYAYEHTPEYQAVMLFKAHVLALATGDLSLTAWYRIHDLKPAEGVIGDAHNRHLGILDLQGHPKPAYYALRFRNRPFDHSTRLIDREIRIEAPADTQGVVHAFERSDGTVIVVGWLRTPRPESVPDTSGMAVDRRAEQIAVTLPTRRLTHLRLFDVLGNPTGAEALPAPTSFHLTLHGDQCAIAQISSR